MCNYPTHLYFTKPLTTPWVGQFTIYRMAHPLRTIVSGILLLFHSETVTSTSRFEFAYVKHTWYQHHTHWSFPWISYSSKISFIMLLVTVYPLVALWVACKTYEAIFLQKSSSVVVLEDQVIPGCWYCTFQLVLLQFPSSQTFFHFVQLLTPFVEAHTNQNDQLHFTLCNIGVNILGWKRHQHGKWYSQVASLMLAAYSTCQSVNNIFTILRCIVT